MVLPEKYTEKMKILLKDEFKDYIDSFNDPRYFGLRVNTLKTTPEFIAEKFNLTERVKWCNEGFYYNEDLRPAKSPYYNAGLYYIQEPSAMSTGSLIEINENDKVLDLCAAPGGKSTQVAAKLKGTGLLVSNDISASRCKALLKNIELFGIENAIITNETPDKLAGKFISFFDKIIVDAPCSGEGMFRKDKDAIKSWDSYKSDMCCDLQRGILDNADKMLKKDGIIAYSTCTFAPEENEGMIEEFITKHPYYEILEVRKDYGFINGKPQWINSNNSDLEKCGRLMPYKVKGEGHFLALLKKNCDTGENNTKYIDSINEKKIQDYIDFENNSLNKTIRDNLTLHGSNLIKVPYGIDLSTLRVMRSGLLLGEIKTKRFEPSQAFAMTLKKEEAINTVNFNIDDYDLIRYLKGESFEVKAHDGWNLVLLEGYPLGWAKVQKNRMKNKYLKGWMI